MSNTYFQSESEIAVQDLAAPKTITLEQRFKGSSFWTKATVLLLMLIALGFVVQMANGIFVGAMGSTTAHISEEVATNLQVTQADAGYVSELAEQDNSIEKDFLNLLTTTTWTSEESYTLAFGSLAFVETDDKSSYSSAFRIEEITQDASGFIATLSVSAPDEVTTRRAVLSVSVTETGELQVVSDGFVLSARYRSGEQ